MATSPDNCILHGLDSDLAELIRESPTLEDHTGVVLLSKRYLAKAYRPGSVKDTIKAMEVAHALGIRVPRVVRSVHCENRIFLVMERVAGDTLHNVWPSLGWWSSFLLALQLRRFILKMRSVTSNTAGSLFTGECLSFWLDDRFHLPVRAAPSDIAAFLTFWTNFKSLREELKKDTHCHLSQRECVFPQPDRLVFTHHDLAPRNIMVDPVHGLWLIDWDYAGFYPMYFEHASMNNFRVPRQWNKLARIRWHLFTWIAAGHFVKETRLLGIVRSRFEGSRAGRLRNIKAQATKSMFPIVSDSESSDSLTED